MFEKGHLRIGTNISWKNKEEAFLTKRSGQV